MQPGLRLPFRYPSWAGLPESPESRPPHFPSPQVSSPTASQATPDSRQLEQAERCLLALFFVYEVLVPHRLGAEGSVWMSLRERRTLEAEMKRAF